MTIGQKFWSGCENMQTAAVKKVASVRSRRCEKVTVMDGDNDIDNTDVKIFYVFYSCHFYVF